MWRYVGKKEKKGEYCLIILNVHFRSTDFKVKERVVHLGINSYKGSF